MNHSYYLILSRFINASGFKIARSSVREAIVKTDGIFDLSKLPQLLSYFFSDLLVIQVDSQMDNFETIITPCFLVKTEANQTRIYVVLNVDTDNVLIFDHDKKDYTITIDEFKKLLKGASIILKEEEDYTPSKELLEAYYKEQEDDKAYKESIQVIDDFISIKECKNIIDFYEENNLFNRSRVAGRNSKTKISGYRTSSSAMMETHQTVPIVSDLKEKIAIHLGCEINKIESLQCVRYYKSEGYKPHFDAFVKKRKLTCLLYLNEGFLGGETYFPEIDFGVSPKLGRLLIFKNLHENNSVISQSYHQGSPLRDGEKYACNIWIES